MHRNHDTPQLNFAQLELWLSRTPILARVHPLVPLCFGSQTRIVTDGNMLLRQLDERTCYSNESALILDNTQNALTERFPSLQSVEHPPVQAINRNMVYHIDYMRSYLLTTHRLAQFIESDVTYHMPDIIVLFLVDGLSYGDVLDWECESIRPCFVDAPSVTFRFYEDKCLNPRVGFASIINRPSVQQRLYSHGYRHPLGFTYWQPESNTIADYMFEGVPYSKVVNFESILRTFERHVVVPQTYLQIVREGLDGLAHNKRELHRIEIESAIDAVFDDVQRLLKVLTRNGQSVRIYLTSDHGILWKKEHDWIHLNGIKDSHARFISHRPPEDLMDYVVRCGDDETPYYLFRYPYLGSRIASNDSGVHGGLSYQESITPLVIFRG